MITWHIVNANGLLEMLIVGHHLREERPLHHTHHRGLFLIIKLRGDAKNEIRINEKFENENTRLACTV